jgi:uncharacterized protein YcbX
VNVEAIWRYPVKSVQGELLDLADVDERGITGDRAWGIADRATGYVLTARREPKLLFATARYVDGDVELTDEDGTALRDDAALSRWLGREVELRAASPHARATFEAPTDDLHEHDAAWTTWHGPAGTFHDSTRTRVSIVSRATLGAWDERRFRANVVVTGDGEDAFVDRVVTIGTAVLRVVKRIDRCVVTTRPQPRGIRRDLDVLRAVRRDRDGHLGVGALVARAGAIAVGDAVTVL